MEMSSKKHMLKQTIIFVVLYVGYMTYILNRKSFSFMLPSITKRENLDSETIGSVLSSMAIGYSIGKFGSSILVDTHSPTGIFSIGLILCGLVSIAFSFTESTALYSILSLANGLFQGCGWPPCGKLLQRWYTPAVFGTLWSLLSTSMNVAASIGPLMCNIIIEKFDSWRICMQIIGGIALLCSVFALLFVRDGPTDDDTAKINDAGISKLSSNSEIDQTRIVREEATKPDSTFMNAMHRVFSSPFSYVMFLIFFVSLLCKVAVCDWGPLYLITEKNATNLTASVFSGILEIGGVLGSIVTGFLTDWIMLKSKNNVRGHPRNLFVIPCTVSLYLFIMCLRTQVTDVSEQHTLTMTIAFAIGFCQYGLISAAGVMTIESSSPDISGRSHAIAALAGNVGMVVGGLPFSMIIENYSWSSAFFLIEGVVLLLATTLILSQGMICRIGYLKKKED